MADKERFNQQVWDIVHKDEQQGAEPPEESEPAE
jgi:hypothetical protein